MISEFSVGQRIIVADGQIATIKYIGPVPASADNIYLGIEYDVGPFY